MSDDDYGSDFESNASTPKAAASPKVVTASAPPPAPARTKSPEPTAAPPRAEPAAPPPQPRRAATRDSMRSSNASFMEEAKPKRSNSSAGMKPSKKQPAGAAPLPAGGGRRAAAAAVAARKPIAVNGKIAATPEEEAILEELRRQNVSLRSQLLEVNRQLDDQLLRRGHDTTMVTAVPRPGAMLPSDRQMLKNEQQRRVNNELRAKLNQADQLAKLQDLGNALGAATALAETLRSENRGLENVHSHQSMQLELTSKIERELADARAEHQSELRSHKSGAKAARELRDADMVLYNKQIRGIERLEEKIRIQDEVGAAVRTVEDIRERVEEKDRMIDALKYQVAVLSKTNTNDKKKAKLVSERGQREMKGLQAEAAELKHQLANLGMAADLGIDTRF